jgi:hypothetical protein
LHEKALVGATDLDTRPHAELQAFLHRNRDVLATCHALLHETCHVVTEFDDGYYDRHIEELCPLRDLAKAFVIEAWGHWRGGRSEKSVACALDILLLGKAMRNGGLVTDLMMGQIVSAAGVEYLLRRRCELDAATATGAAKTVAHIDREEEPMQDILARDEEWEKIVQPDAGEPEPADDCIDPTGESDEEQRAIVDLLNELVKQPDTVRQMQLQNEQRHRAMLRLLAIELGLIAYRENHNQWPDELESLVPHFLDDIPVDPFSNSRFVFRQYDDSYVLYSIGPNGRDDGGLFREWRTLCCEGGDLCLDYMDFFEIASWPLSIR